MTKRPVFLLPVLLFVIVAGYFAWGLTDPDRDPRAVRSALVGKAVPDFDLPPVDGLDLPGLATRDLTEGGQVTLVNLFASWCIPCRAEHPIFMRLAEEDRVRLVGINYRDKPDDAAAWLEDLGNPYERIGADETARAGLEWGVSGVPETFVIDAQGMIRHQHIGPLTPADLERVILPLVDGLTP